MVFYSFYKGAIYTVIPGVPQTGYGPSRPGVRAYFKNHVFDSEHAAVAHNWSDETREAVENYLKGHSDFGLTLSTSRDAEPAAEALEGCGIMIPVPEGAERCGARVTEGLDYCARHVALLAELPGPDVGLGEPEEAMA